MKKYYFCFGIMIVVVCVISLLLLGEVGAQEAPAEGEKVEEQEPVEDVKQEEKQGEKVKKDVMFNLDPLIVNLARSQGSKFLKITISL